MAARLLPDAEELVIAYLLASDDIAALVGERVFPELPQDQDEWPILLVERVGGLPAAERHLDAPEIELQAWADTKAEARTLAATAQAVLQELVGIQPPPAPSGPPAIGVVSGIEHVNGLQWVPDPETGRPRYVFEIRVFVHPPPA